MTDLVATDLHGHSHHSDGRVSPTEYVQFRARIGLSVIALSDHDTTAGVREAVAAAAGTAVTVVPALEVTSTIHFGTPQVEQVHVLAYFPPAVLTDGRLEQTALFARSRALRGAWRAFVTTWVAGLPAVDRDALGLDPGLDDDTFPQLQTFIGLIAERRPSLYPHFQLHHVHFWEDAALFGQAPEAVMELIRGDGALDIVAHPHRIRDKARMQQALDHASGVEAYTSRHKVETAEEYRDWAVARGKHWTASTDDHQHAPYAKPRSGTPRRTVERILAGA